jgi:SAM-dependent methyltransferase
MTDERQPGDPAADADARRTEQLDRWDRASAGWARRAEQVRESGMLVSMWMIEHAVLQPGERVLELAAGPGDTGFLAAELIKPGGTLVSSDGSEKMLEVARARAERQGIDNVEFKLLQLEWIDEETASVDAILCRWGVMLSVDPAAALQECRRVLRPGGRLAMAVWDAPERNPWATIPNGTLVELGYGPPPDPNAPGPFAMSAPGRIGELLADAGFIDPLIETVLVDRYYDDFEGFLDETLDLSFVFGSAWAGLDDDQQAKLMHRLEAKLAPFTAADGTLSLPGSSLVALADA